MVQFDPSQLPVSQNVTPVPNAIARLGANANAAPELPSNSLDAPVAAPCTYRLPRLP